MPQRFGCSLISLQILVPRFTIRMVAYFYNEISNAKIEALNDLPDLGENVSIQPKPSKRQLRFEGAVRGWKPSTMSQLMPEKQPNFDEIEIPGNHILPQDPIFAKEIPEWWTLTQHGLVKGRVNSWSCTSS